MKNGEIEKSQPTFIISTFKTDIIKMGLVFLISNYFIAKTSLANNWRSFSSSYSALVEWQYATPWNDLTPLSSAILLLSALFNLAIKFFDGFWRLILGLGSDSRPGIQQPPSPRWRSHYVLFATFRNCITNGKKPPI